MASSADLSDSAKGDEKWTPYQRPGKLGVDYDEYGAEMAPSARVWRRYVEETDRMDKELVDGWNKTLDIILIFAALFSAISTAFVIESSKDLKPDYTESSAKSLLLMSQTLSAISRGSPVNESITPNQELVNFTPTAIAVAVNALWFLSLSLSVAVSFIAILAKEWCYSFMAGRVGTMLRQARLRQQRWDGIEKWKMKEILYVLPLLMHTALLLFAVGLSLHLWSINIGVALPVVVTTILAGLFYGVTVSLPLFFRFCPYTTELVRLLYPYWIRLLGRPHTKNFISILTALAAYALDRLRHLKRPLKAWRSHSYDQVSSVSDIESVLHGDAGTLCSFSQHHKDAQMSVNGWIDLMRGMFLTNRFQLVEQETPMDDVTSSMISWMVANCEDSKSVDVALQALAGGDLRLLPRQPLWECGAIQLLTLRIESCCSELKLPHNNGRKQSYNMLLDEASLYSRSLTFLTAFIHGEGLDCGSGCFVSEKAHEMGQLSQDEAGRLSRFICWGFSVILNSSWVEPRRYELAAFEFNSVPAKAGRQEWGVMMEFGDRRSRQHELLRAITTGRISNLPPVALLSLVQSFTKSYLHEPSQSPILLVDLLNMLRGQEGSSSSSELQWAIGICLTIAALARNDGCPSGAYFCDDLPHPYITQAKALYHELEAKDTSKLEPEFLLTFGLLELLRKPRLGNCWEFTQVELKSIGRCFRSIPVPYSGAYRLVLSTPPVDYDPRVPFEPAYHYASLVTEWLDRIIPDSGSTSESGDPLEFDALGLSYIDALLHPEWCNDVGELVIPVLMKCFVETRSPALKEQCLEALQPAFPTKTYSQSNKSIFREQLVQGDFLNQLLEFKQSAARDQLPYALTILWMAAIVLESDDVDLRRNLGDTVPVASTENDIPLGPHELGLADLWLCDIKELCISNPKKLLGSNILDLMIEFYLWHGNGDLYPTDPSDGTCTWLDLLSDLKENCKAHAAGQLEKIHSEDEQLNEETTLTVSKPDGGHNKPHENI